MELLPNILFVDDDEDILGIYQLAIQDEGVNIHTASNGFDACKIVEEYQIDIAFIDLMMPGLNGIETLKRLKNMNNAIDIVMLTAYGSIETAVEAMREGAYDYLHKPLEMEKLKTTIKNILQKRQLSFKLDKKIAELSAIHEATRLLSSTTDFDDLSVVIMATIVKVMHADEDSLMLLDKTKDELYITVSKGIDKEIVRSQRIKRGEDVAGWVLEHNEPVLIVGNAANDKRFTNVTNHHKVTSCMCVPLRVKDGVIGVLRINKIKTIVCFTMDDLMLASIFAAEIGGAIERSKTYATLEEKMAELTDLNLQLKELFLNTVKALSSAIDAKDPYTMGHSSQVQKHVIAIADELNFSTDEKNLIGIIGLLHDIGKIGIKDGILSKPGALEREEWEMIKEHPDIGSKIVKHIDMFNDVAEIILHHHERYDGNGYPSGLKGEQIPLKSRILSVADSFDAMVSKRPYRDSMPREKAIMEVKAGSGTQFDPVVVDAFLRVLEREDAAIRAIDEL
ncbi:MAG: HD domain-containing phosphohydrolase [Candidatus Desantisbacteria bacterium]